MRSRSKTTMTIVASIAAAGAVAAATLPANAADKGDSSSRVTTHKTITGAAVAGTHASPRLSQLRTGDGCSAYADGHGDLCLWYFSNFSGSRTGFLRNDSNLADDRFVGAGAGQGSTVTNNAESVWNYDRFVTAWAATSPSFGGSNGFISPNSGGNFNATYKNNTESIFWAS